MTGGGATANIFQIDWWTFP